MATNIRNEHFTAIEPPHLNGACARGLHRPRRVPIGGGGTSVRTTCRDCGCALARTGATRRWFYSGVLA